MKFTRRSLGNNPIIFIHRENGPTLGGDRPKQGHIIPSNVIYPRSSLEFRSRYDKKIRFSVAPIGIPFFLSAQIAAGIHSAR